jgi:hypothetical protein
MNKIEQGNPTQGPWPTRNEEILPDGRDEIKRRGAKYMEKF